MAVKTYRELHALTQDLVDVLVKHGVELIDPVKSGGVLGSTGGCAK